MFGKSPLSGGGRGLHDIRKLSKLLIPKVQNPAGVYAICSDIQYRESGSEDAKIQCLVLLTAYIHYAEKHQAPSFFNRLVGRVRYVCTDDSYVYSLCADLLRALEGSDSGSIGRLYEKAYYLDEGNPNAAHYVRSGGKDSKCCLADSYAKVHGFTRNLKKCFMFTSLLTVITVFMDFVPIYLGCPEGELPDRIIFYCSELLLVITLLMAAVYLKMLDGKRISEMGMLTKSRSRGIVAILMSNMGFMGGISVLVIDLVLFCICGDNQSWM